MEKQNLPPSIITSNAKWKSVMVALIVAFMLSVGLTIYSFVQNNNKQSQIDALTDSLETANNVKPVDKCDDTTIGTPPIDDNNEVGNTDAYLVVQEWGLKIKMRDADKISLVGESGASDTPVQYWAGGETGAYYDAFVGYTINDGVLNDKSCGQEGIGTLYRLIDTGNLTNYRIIGDYAYVIAVGSGVPCGSDKNAEDTALFQRLLEDFSLANIEQIIPFVHE